MKILKFYADWCQPCKMLTRVIEDAKPNVEVEIVPINIDNDNVTAARFGVRGIPMLVIVDESGAEVKRRSGMMTEKEYIDFVSQ